MKVINIFTSFKYVNKGVNIERFTNSDKKPNVVIKAEDIPKVKWPFKNLKDENNKNVNMLCITAHMNDEHKKEFLDYYNKGIKFIGCSSYLSYPRLCDNKNGYCHLDDKIKINGKYIEDYVLGWCHCFKEPEKYIKNNIPKILISESDFNSDRLKPKDYKIEYDYLTVLPNDPDCRYGWSSHNKNWNLGKKCIEIFNDDMNLKGFISSRRSKCDLNINKEKNLEISEHLKYNDFIDKMNKSKFILMPNLEDASPRVLVEALSLNKPVLVNENILGGWKYVNNKTGEFFNENNIKKQTEKLLKNIENNQYSPRQYYTSKYGSINSGKRLKQFLKSIYPELSNCDYVKLSIN